MVMGAESRVRNYSQILDSVNHFKTGAIDCITATVQTYSQTGEKGGVGWIFCCLEAAET